MKHIAPLFIFSLLLLLGCSSEDLHDENSTPSIGLKGEVVTTSNEVTRDDPINGLGVDCPITLLRGDMNTTLNYTTWDSKSDATLKKDGVIENSLFYLSQENRSSKLTGFYPRSGSWTAGTKVITFTTLNGKTDVLCSKFVEGSKKSPMTSKKMEFHHMLSQIVLKVKCTSDAQNKWRKVTGATLTGVAPNVLVALPAPTEATAAIPTSKADGIATNNSLTFTSSKGGTPTAIVPTTTVEDFACVMFPPVTAANMGSLKLTVHTEDGSFPAPLPASLIKSECAAGTSYILTLEFTVTGIKIENAAIAPWTPVVVGNISI